MTFLGAPDAGPGLFAALTAASFVTAFLGVFTGTAGGLLLLGTMAVLMPPAAVIPVHTVVQFGSGLARTAIMWRYVMRSLAPPFILGAALGAAVGARLLVHLPTPALEAILGSFILVVTWIPKLGRVGAARGRFLAIGFVATFVGMFVSATGTIVAPFVASAAPDRRNHSATVGALMTCVHAAKLAAFGALGFAVNAYLPLIGMMIVTGAAGNWLGREALERVSEGRFRLILHVLLSVLALKLMWSAAAAYLHSEAAGS